MARYNLAKLIEQLDGHLAKANERIDEQLAEYDRDVKTRGERLDKWRDEQTRRIVDVAAKIADGTVTDADLNSMTVMSNGDINPTYPHEYTRKGLEDRLRARLWEFTEPRAKLEILQPDEQGAISLTVQELRALGLSWLVAGR